MPTEREGIPLTAIHLNLADQSITLEAQDQTVATITFSTGTIYFQTATVPTEHTQEPPALPSSSESREKDLATLTGKLKTKPKEGRPDGKGHPTTWARLAHLLERYTSACSYWLMLDQVPVCALDVSLRIIRRSLDSLSRLSRRRIGWLILHA